MKEMNQGPREEKILKFTPERINAFSDGVFAIIITIMILELKRPASPTFSALFALWPTWISYIVSYVFIAIVWVNHHYLLRHATDISLGLIWVNFAHLFCVSLIPFLTDWIAETHLMSVPVFMYAFIFLLVNLTYLLLFRQIAAEKNIKDISDRSKRLLHLRSAITITIFASAMIFAIRFPYVGFGLVCFSLILYLRPDISGRYEK